MEQLEKTINYIENNTKSFNELVDKKVIMKNLPENITEKEIENIIIEKCPLINIKNIRVVKDEKGNGRGFVFIDFESNENALECVSNINDLKINNNIITCALSKPPNKGENDIRTLFVNNLSYDSNEESI